MRPGVEAFGDIAAAWRDDYVERMRGTLRDEPTDAAEVELRADRWMTIRRRASGKPFAVDRRA